MRINPWRPVDIRPDAVEIPGPPGCSQSSPADPSVLVGVGGYGVDVTDRDAQPLRNQIEVRRSARRRRTVSAYREGERIVVLIPARFSRLEEQRWVKDMVERVTARERRDRDRGPRRSDAALARRCRELSAQYLGGTVAPASVRWVDTMRTRWASCTPADRTIRVSSRLRDVPSWVLDYVLVHELAHLRVVGHGREFWALVARYPRTERARGYLDGVSAAAQLPIADDLADDVERYSDEAS
jgi:predicted metal-dependent hydrolase